MILSDKLLKSKELTPIQKLIIGLIINESPIVMRFNDGYDKTCGEIGKELGLSRSKVRVALDEMVIKGYVSTEYGRAWRKTNLTTEGENFKD